MKVIKPIVITDAILSSSDIVENDATEWTSGGSFALGATCMVTTTANGAGAATHKIYESLTSSNSGNDPTDQVNNADKWLEISATNRWKMFD